MTGSDDFLNFFGAYFPGIEISKILGIAEIVGRVEGAFKQGLVSGGFTEDQAESIVKHLNATLLKELRDTAMGWPRP